MARTIDQIGRKTETYDPTTESNMTISTHNYEDGYKSRHRIEAELRRSKTEQGVECVSSNFPRSSELNKGSIIPLPMRRMVSYSTLR